jgi:trehalose 6-phosphate phosphatase
VNTFLALAGSSLLEEVARTRTLLAFDFDGTLAPIVDDRNRAEMRPETHALLRVAGLLYPCAVVSGRMRSDLVERLRGLPLVAAIGCHGAEPGFGPLDPLLQRRVAAWRPALEKALIGSPEIEVEDKRFSIALHFRRARSPGSAGRDALAAARSLPGAIVFPGHAVVNVVPREAPTKGDAVATLCRRLGIRPAVYVGDDGTDEWAFRSSVVGVAIRIGASADSSAACCLADQSQIDDLLRALIAARLRQDGRGERIEGLIRAVVS